MKSLSLLQGSLEFRLLMISGPEGPTTFAFLVFRLALILWMSAANMKITATIIADDARIRPLEVFIISASECKRRSPSFPSTSCAKMLALDIDQTFLLTAAVDALALVEVGAISL